MVGEVNEGSSAMIELSFFDENGLPVVPTLVTWRLDDVFTNTNYALNQSFVPTGSIEVVSIQPSWNNIIDTNRQVEYRRMTVTYTLSPTRVGTEEVRWAVKNLRHI